MSAYKSYGVVSLAEQREMSGLEFVRGLVTGSLPLNTMAKTLGYDIVEAEEGRVVIAAMASADHMNPNGTIHGGVAATLLDSCMGLAVRTLLPRDVGSTTLEFKISFLRPVTTESGLLRAEGKALMVGRRSGIRRQAPCSRDDDLPQFAVGSPVSAMGRKRTFVPC